MTFKALRKAANCGSRFQAGLIRFRYCFSAQPPRPGRFLHQQAIVAQLYRDNHPRRAFIGAVTVAASVPSLSGPGQYLRCRYALRERSPLRWSSPAVASWVYGIVCSPEWLSQRQ